MSDDGSRDAYDLDQVMATNPTPPGESPRAAGFAAPKPCENNSTDIARFQRVTDVM